MSNLKKLTLTPAEFKALQKWSAARDTMEKDGIHFACIDAETISEQTPDTPPTRGEAIATIKAAGPEHVQTLKGWMHEGEYECQKTGPQWVNSMTLHALKSYIVEHIQDYGTSNVHGLINDLKPAA